MAVSQLNSGGVYNGLVTRNRRESYPTKQLIRSLLPQKSGRIREFCAVLRGNKVRGRDAGYCSVSANHNRMLLSSPVMRQRKRPFSEVKNKLTSDFSVQTSDTEETSAEEEEYVLASSEERVS